MSSRERIAQMRAEADAAAKEKEAAKAAKAGSPALPRKSSKKAPSPPARVRIVWSVCDPSGKEVQQFPYAKEQEARAEAHQLTVSTGKTHFVKQSDVPVG
jgi:hypothetical protein